MTEHDSDSLIEYPCRFPIKIVCRALVGIEQTMVSLVRMHAPDLNDYDVRSRESNGGKYIGITVVVTAVNRVQLDAIYQMLSDHPDVIMAL
ncbi:MAG: DUF493 domain-containing protein [Gammaproteobacteria bacterium]|nr:DUF493 domain-containing protein [Gammaproteobacteria bacterium]